MVAEPVAGPASRPASGRISRLARAKVNLTLHLCGRRPDGRHLLESLVVFPEIGDDLSAVAAPETSLRLSGPFGAALAADPGNLVLGAASALAALAGGAPDAVPGAALHLVKNLPVASGIGGGSADAAAALDLLSELWDVPVPEGLALALGADVPVCRAAPQAMRMRGIGERLTPAPPLPRFWLVLVNPGIAVATGAVFAGVADPHPPAPPEMPARGFPDLPAFTGWLATQRNDLEAPARALCPAIGEVLAALSAAPLARMSGSGATCFALLPDRAGATALAATLRRARPDWWVAAAPAN